MNGRQLIWPDSRTSESRWISERFLSREGSGEADRRIPGAHEASGKLFLDGSSTALKERLVGKLSRQLVMQRNRLTSCDANPRPGMKHSFQFDHLSALFRPFSPSLRLVNRNRIPSLPSGPLPIFVPCPEDPSRSQIQIPLHVYNLPSPPSTSILSLSRAPPHATVQSSPCFRALSLTLIPLIPLSTQPPHEPALFPFTSYPTFGQRCPTSSKTDIPKLPPT